MKKFNLLFLLVTLFLMLTLLFSAEAQKRYIVHVALKSGETLKGVLIRTTKDSLTIQKKIRNLPPIRLGASEIKSIRIRKRGSMRLGLGIGAGTGAIIGGIIGYASYTPPDCSNSLFCFDFGPEFDTIGGGLIGAAAGSLVGLAIGSAGKEFIVEGDQTRFDLFADEFKKTGSPMADQNSEFQKK